MTTEKDEGQNFVLFSGHVVSMRVGRKDKIEVTLQTPSEEADGKEWIINVPSDSAAHWIPGRIVRFEITSTLRITDDF